jgi:N-acetyl-gamma-glutamyl-phosphate reductase
VSGEIRGVRTDAWPEAPGTEARVDVAWLAGEQPAAASMRVAARPGARLVVLGASGYTGQELGRLALAHPGLEVVALGSREHAGATAETALPGLDARARPLPPLRDPAELASWFERGAADTLVSCLPHGAWRELAAEHPALAALPAWIVDLSADRRDGSDGWAYGLPEAFRDTLAGVPRIANPGCYPTAFALALLPAAAAGLLDGPVSVAALSGVSGAGRGASARTSFVELDGGASIYRAGAEHPHVAEMERTLARLGAPLPVGFVPQLVPMARGILLTANVALSRPHDPDEMRTLYRVRYAREPFVRVLPAGAWPETRAVRHSNRCDVAVTTLHGGRTLLATAAIDNLVKGAAGQALQNLNLMLGWPETTGLPAHGLPW